MVSTDQSRQILPFYNRRSLYADHVVVSDASKDAQDVVEDVVEDVKYAVEDVKDIVNDAHDVIQYFGRRQRRCQTLSKTRSVASKGINGRPRRGLGT